MLALHLLILAIIQGVTELFPISSLGHSILVQTHPAEAASIGLPLSCGPPAQT